MYVWIEKDQFFGKRIFVLGLNGKGCILQWEKYSLRNPYSSFVCNFCGMG